MTSFDRVLIGELQGSTMNEESSRPALSAADKETLALVLARLTLLLARQAPKGASKLRRFWDDLLVRRGGKKYWQRHVPILVPRPRLRIEAVCQDGKKDEWRKQAAGVSLVPPEKRPRTISGAIWIAT
jgi:hypothetical protein